MNDFGGWRVYVQRDWTSGAGRFGVWLAQRRFVDGAPRTQIVEPVTFTMADHDEAVVLPGRPSLTLDDDLGKALLDELAGYYGGTGELRSLRKDYDAERARVDKFIAHLTRVQS